MLSLVDGRAAAAAAGIIAPLGRRNDGLETEIADILAADSDLRAEAGVTASSIIVTVAGLLLGPADSESPPLGVLPSTLNVNAPLSMRSGIFGGLESRVASAKALPTSRSISSSTSSILPFFTFVAAPRVKPKIGGWWDNCRHHMRYRKVLVQGVPDFGPAGSFCHFTNFTIFFCDSDFLCTCIIPRDSETHAQ